MSTSRILFYSCLSFIAGVFAGSFFSTQYIWALPFCGFFLLFGRKGIYFLFMAVFILGIARYQPKIPEIKKYNNNEITILARVAKEPEIKENSIQLTLKGTRLIIGEDVLDVEGKFLVNVREYPEYRYNDVLLLKGLLKEPESFDAFDYKNYLEKKGIHSLMSFPEIQIVKRESSFYGAVLNFKNKIRENINKSFGYLQAKLLSGILLGDQSTFSQEFKDKLNVSGLRHITAISGMNVAILCTILMSLFLGLGLWRSQAFYFTVFAIFLFVLTVGFQASVIRAGIMGIFVLLAQKTGRMSDSIRILVITSTIMLLVNPMMLRWDAGFQLSFLALLGLVLLQKHMEKLLKFIPNIINLRAIIAATLSAQVFTLPILIYNFGRMSLISPITNILVVPVVDFLMILGLLFSFLSLISLGWILIIPCWLILSYILLVIDLFSGPVMSLSINNVSWVWLLISYLILFAVVFYIKRKERLKFLSY